MIERLLAAEQALDGGQVEVAERLFGQVAAADPRNAIAVVGLARTAQRRGEIPDALAHARRALEIDPDDAAAQRLVAELSAAPRTGAQEPAAAAAPVGPASGALRSSRRGGFLARLRRLILGRD